MTDIAEKPTALGDVAARTLANATQTVPMLSAISPRWLVHLLQFVPVEAGIYRVNRVKDEAAVAVDCSGLDERVLPQTFVDYEEWGREYRLSAVNTVVDVHTRVRGSGRGAEPRRHRGAFGHHCAQPILRRFGVEGTVRPSLALYNNCADIDALVAAMKRIAAGG